MGSVQPPRHSHQVSGDVFFASDESASAMAAQAPGRPCSVSPSAIEHGFLAMTSEI